MDVWSDFLGYKSDFLSILRSLCGGDYDKLNNRIPEQEARFLGLLKLHYVKNLTDIDDLKTLTPVDGFVLICIYAWIRAVEKFQSPDDLAPLFLVFGRYLIAAYQFHITYNPNSTEEISNNKEAKSWILSNKFNQALDELRISLPGIDLENGRKRLADYKPDDSLSRPLHRGVELLHGEVCSLFGIKPIFKTSEKSHSQNKSVKLKPEQAQNIRPWDPPVEQIKISHMLASSPILRSYWESKEFKQAFNYLWDTEKRLPTIRQSVLGLISKALDGTTLTSDQRLIAMDLLQDISSWGLTQKPPRLSITRQEASFYGGQRHYKSDLSLLLEQLLNCGLLLSDGLNIRVALPIVSDFSLTYGWLRHYGSPTLLPPGGKLTFSQWIYWTLDHLIAENRTEEAGRYLYRIQGSLPGCASRSWVEIIWVLGLLPDLALRDPLIWTILTAAIDAMDSQGYLQEDDFNRSTLNLYLRVPQAADGKVTPDIHEKARQFRSGIKQYLTFKKSTGTLRYRTDYWGLFHQILEKPKKSSGGNNWVKVHFLSDLRYSQIDERNSHLASSSPYQKALMKEAETSDETIRLAIAELFAFWKDPIALELFEQNNGSNFLPPEISTRGTILQMSYQFPREYGEWV